MQLFFFPVLFPLFCGDLVLPTLQQISVIFPFQELWQRIGMDLFEWKKLEYLTIMGYYSRFIEIAQLDRTTAEAVILHCKKIFLRLVIRQEVVTDNGS